MSRVGPLDTVRAPHRNGGQILEARRSPANTRRVSSRNVSENAGPWKLHLNSLSAMSKTDLRLSKLRRFLLGSVTVLVLVLAAYSTYTGRAPRGAAGWTEYLFVRPHRVLLEPRPVTLA